MNEHEIKQEANHCFESLVKYFEQRATDLEQNDTHFDYAKGLASAFRHAIMMVNIRSEFFNSITKTYNNELPASL